MLSDGGRRSAVERELRSVLIVEDDAGIREALAECVATLGLEVATARDGRDGLDQLHAGMRPGAVLLGASMPHLDGHRFLEAVRSDADLAEMAVVDMFTSRDRPALPVNAFLEKPFDLDELARVLRRLGAQKSTDPMV